MTTKPPPNDDDVDYPFEERAGILEFDAGMDRAAAELKARQYHPRPAKEQAAAFIRRAQALKAAKANSATVVEAKASGLIGNAHKPDHENSSPATLAGLLGTDGRTVSGGRAMVVGNAG